MSPVGGVVQSPIVLHSNRSTHRQYSGPQFPEKSQLSQGQVGYMGGLKYYSKERLLEYKNLFRDFIKILTTNPGTTIQNLYSTIFRNGSNPITSFIAFIGAIANSFVDSRVKPYVAAIKERDFGKVGAILTVDALDILTFAALFKGLQALRGLLFGVGPIGPGAGAGLKALALPGGGLVPPSLLEGAKKVAISSGTVVATWSIGNAGLRSVISSGANGFQPKNTGTPEEIRSHQLQVEMVAQILRQNGLALNPFALNQLSDRGTYSRGDLVDVQERLLTLNKANLPIVQRELDPAYPRKFNGITYDVTSLELNYIRWLPQERFEAIKALADRAEGMKFLKRLLDGVPVNRRNELPRLVNDLRTYVAAVLTLQPDYKLGPDPDLDAMLSMQAPPKSVLAYKIRKIYPGMADQAIAEYVERLWRNLTPLRTSA